MKLATILLCLLLTGCATKTTKRVHMHKRFVNSMVVMDGPEPPCYPNCGTNFYWPPFTTPVYTNGELFCKVISDSLISVSNTSPYKEYVLQFTTNLPGSWTTFTASQVGRGENFYSVTNQGSQGFYRAQDVTGDDLIVYPTYGATNSQTGSTCPYNFVGYWVYRSSVANIFPFQPMGTNHVVIDPTFSTDTVVELLGRFGSHYCDYPPLTTPSTLPDPYYALTVYFGTTMMGTNYPIVLKGFIVRTN